jgi:large conductance mechanosensitive channel
MGLVKEFREFAMRGNVVDMAVGIIIGAAFGKIVSTLVNNVMMPPLGMLIGGVDFADKKLVLKEGAPALITADGAPIEAVSEVAIGYGMFINEVINFTIVAFAIFMLIKLMNTARKRFERQEEAAPPPPPPADVVLLTEIRDLLKQQV